MYFQLFSNCIIVDGHTKSIICDLQNSSIIEIPKSLANILPEVSKVKKDEFENHFDKETIGILYNFFEFFEEQDVGFWTNYPELFSTMPIQWESSSKINNAIIEVENNTTFVNLAIPQLNELGCKFIEYRIFDNKTSAEQIKSLLNITKETGIFQIQLFIANIDFEEIEKLYTVKLNFPRVEKIYCFNQENAVIDDSLKDFIFVSNNELQNSSCGIIEKARFAINIPTYTESQNFNTCLNRKISIDANGNIKNCPSLIGQFGNLAKIHLSDVIQNQEFTGLWEINKDQISVCKVCEYRHICTDCRAYVENPSDIYSKPLKCGYNPYTGIWDEWSDNPLKAKAILFYEIEY